MAVEINSETYYTVSEIHDLANRYNDQYEGDDEDDLTLPLALSGFVAWLEKREPVTDNLLRFEGRRESE